MGTERFTFGIRTDVIAELRTAAGVTIDGVALKDSQVNGLTISSGAALNSIAAEAVTAGTDAGVSVVDYNAGGIHRTVVTLTAVAMAALKGTGSTGYGKTKLFTFPEGAVDILGVSVCLTAAVTADWAPTTPVASLGTTGAAADNATLTTTEVDVMASTALTIAANATALKVLGPATLRPVFDGSATAKDLYLNFACNSDPSVPKGFVWTGKVYVLWGYLGDLT